MSNTGNFNSGKYNTGDSNSGHSNSGYSNSGNYNSGNYNSGHSNSGYANSGDSNSGYYNTGDYNTGNRNSGDCNTGDCNTGNYNTGNYNTGNCNSGYFNTDTPTVRMFNVDTGMSIEDINVPHISLELNVWDETEDQLLTYTYKEAWANWWNIAEEHVKQKLLDLPHFDADIFKEITGIDTKSTVKIEVDGKVVRISRESAIALNLIKG